MRSKGRLIGSICAGALLIGASALAANSRTFTDPAGDGGAAPDITTLVVSSDDNGTITFALTLANPSLLTGSNFVAIFLDVDRNASTGAPAGSEYTFDFNPTGPGLTRWNGSNFVTAAAASLVRIGPTTASINRSDLGGTTGFGLRATAFGPGEARDRGPDTDSWTYDLQLATTATDADGDGVRDTADKCPRTKAGRFDSNRNGCPGPFRTITPEPKNPGVASAGTTKFSSVVFRRIPPGAKLLIRGPSFSENVTATSAGSASSRALRRTFRDGTIITVRITKPGWVGYHGQFRVGPPLGLKRVTKRCIPATGRQVPVRCSKALRGR